MLEEVREDDALNHHHKQRIENATDDAEHATTILELEALRDQLIRDEEVLLELILACI